MEYALVSLDLEVEKRGINIKFVVYSSKIVQHSSCCKECLYNKGNSFHILAKELILPWKLGLTAFIWQIKSTLGDFCPKKNLRHEIKLTIQSDTSVLIRLVRLEESQEMKVF